ncbi:hypothetical protein Tco_1216505 [Tanacetum coccineum]
MVLVDHTGWKLRRKQWTSTTDQLIEDLEAAYGFDFDSQIMHTICFRFEYIMVENFKGIQAECYTGISEPMFYNYLRPLTSLNEGLYALACEEDVHFLATLVRSFKLIEVYIEHGVTALDSYLMAPRFRATIEEITDDPGGIAANRTEKMLLLTWHESCETTKEPVCDSVIPSSFPQHDSITPCKDSVCESITLRCMLDCILNPPTDESLISYTQLSGVQGVDTQSHVIDDVMRQLSFDETKLDREAGFADVARSGVDSLRLSHDESFGVDDLDLNLNEPVNLNVSQVKTQSELLVSEEPDVGRTQEPILVEVPIVEEVETHEFSMEDVVLKDYVSSGEDDEQYNSEFDESTPSTDDDDVDKDFLVDEENEIVEPDVDVHLFGISMDLPFYNIGVTNIVSDDVLEGENVDVINADGFDNDPGNDKQTNYRKRKLAELRTEMKGVINASGQWKYSFYTSQKFTTPKEAKEKVYMHSIESKRNLKQYKNDGVRIRARCNGKVPVFTMEIKHCTYKFLSEKIFEQVRVNPDIPVKAVQDQLQRELEVQISMSKPFRAKAKPEREIRGDHVLQYSMLRDYVVKLQSTKLNTTVKIAVERNTDLSLPTRCLGDDIYLHPNSNFIFIGDKQKGIIPAIKTMYPSAEHIYCLRHIHENMNQGWCGPSYKDLLWRAASATNVRDFEKFHFSGRAKFDLLLNNICEVVNGIIVGGRDKPVITLLEYIKEYCMKKIMNVQGMIDKCTGPLTPTATRIMESIKKEAHLMKVQWNRANKYQVSGLLGDQCIVDAVGRPRKKRKRSKHEDEPFVKDGKLSRKGRTITCQSYRNTRHNKATCKGQGRKATTGGNNAEASGSASRQAQQTEPKVGQDGSGGSGAGAVIGLSAVAGEGGAGVASQGSSHSRWTKRRVQTERISPQKRTLTKLANQPSTSFQVAISETRNADGREMGDGVPIQSSAAGGASKCSFL